MDDCKDEPTPLADVDEYQALLSSHAAGVSIPVVIQFGSEACPRCPAFKQCVSTLKKSYNFKWYYVDAHSSDLPEHLQITMLPAAVLLSALNSTNTHVVCLNNASTSQLTEAVQTHCMPILKLDDDF